MRPGANFRPDLNLSVENTKMKLLGLVIFALSDAGLRLVLNKYIFKDMIRAWQLWGALFYAMWPVETYLEILGGRGIIKFPLASMHPVGFWSVIIIASGMILFHALAFTNLFDRWRR